jgi:hypothetical protein
LGIDRDVEGRHGTGTEPARIQEVFHVSLLADTLGLLIMAMVFFISGIISLMESIAPPVSAVLAFVISILLLITYLFFQRTFQVKTAVFTEDSFKIDFGGQTLGFFYGQVEGVSLMYKSLLNLVVGPYLEIRIIDMQSGVILHRNPRNRRLKLDLHGWLLKQAHLVEPK